MEDGDAFDLKITINLKKNELSAGSLNLSVGNVHILLLHRVIRLLQLYLSPINLNKVWSRLLPSLHWCIGPSLRVLQSRDRHIIVRIKMDGPTLLIPEMKENHHLYSIYLGKISLENMILNDGAVENLMLELADGQITRAVMNMNQCIDEHAIIIEGMAGKMDIKRNRRKGTKEAVISVDNIVVNIAPNDIQLALHILQNNLLKMKDDLRDLIPEYSFGLSEEQEPLVLQDSNWSTHLMIDQVKCCKSQFLAGNSLLKRSSST